MANILAPFGFRHVGYLGGFSPTFEPDTKFILKTNTTAIFHNDPVTTASGYVGQSVAGTNQIAGVFQSVTYQSTAKNGQMIRQDVWTGSTDAMSDGVAQVITHPLAVFIVQANGLLTLANINKNANFSLANPGSTLTGLSGAVLDTTTIATTATLPFRIIDLASTFTTAPYRRGLMPGANGSDGTTAYNYAYVTFNNQDYKVLTGL